VSRLPEPMGEGGDALVPRRLSNEQFEVVIRRAAELQARAAESSDEGLTEAEALRIGRELGLSGEYLSRALAEVRGQAREEGGVLDRFVGAAVLQASRVVPGGAASVARHLEGYLVEREFFSVLRRLPDRVVYEPAPGAVAAVSRAMSRAFGGKQMLRVSNLEAMVQPLEEGFCHVTLLTRLNQERTEHLAGGVLGGGAAGTMVAVALGIAVDPAAALLGVPVLGGGLVGMRWSYVRTLHRTQVKLESLLDRLEHGELPPPPPLRPGRGR
jgi:hypothetical protein